jgi:hypothetical protein
MVPGYKFIIWLDEGDDDIIFDNTHFDIYVSSADEREPRDEDGDVRVHYPAP